MFKHSISVGRIFGIDLELDTSWFLIFGLLTWVLAVSYYPAEFHGGNVMLYWLMGAVTAAMLFASVLLHELGHSVVALRHGLPVPRITLFIFGGVSQIAEEPKSALSEFWIAIAGPLVSLAVAAVFAAMQLVFAGVSPLLALAKYLTLLNLMLAAFNLAPGFPLDGGRIFRAILWGITQNLQRATTIAAVTGQAFGYLMIFGGVWQALSGAFFNGLWIAFIGWFLESAARSQLQMQTLRTVLAGHTVAEIMRRDLPTVPGVTTIQELVDHHILAGGRRSFIVRCEDGRAGLVTTSTLKEVPRPEWPSTRVEEVMIPHGKLISIPPSAEVWTALEEMGRDGVNQLPVVENGGIVGLVSREDVLQYLTLWQAFGQ